LIFFNFKKIIFNINIENDLKIYKKIILNKKNQNLRELKDYVLGPSSFG
jgi:hypothetical protein